MPPAAVPGVTVSVEEPLPPATLAGLNAAEAPEGTPVTLSATALEKPLIGETETLAAAPALPEELTEPGLTEIEKSGVATLVMVQLTLVEWLNAPLVPVTVTA